MGIIDFTRERPKLALLIAFMIGYILGFLTLPTIGVIIFAVGIVVVVIRIIYIVQKNKADMKDYLDISKKEEEEKKKRGSGEWVVDNDD